MGRELMMEATRKAEKLERDAAVAKQECGCSHADIDPATRARIQASAARTHEATYGDGSEALAAVTGRRGASSRTKSRQ